MNDAGKDGRKGDNNVVENIGTESDKCSGEGSAEVVKVPFEVVFKVVFEVVFVGRFGEGDEIDFLGRNVQGESMGEKIEPLDFEYFIELFEFEYEFKFKFGF